MDKLGGHFMTINSETKKMFFVVEIHKDNKKRTSRVRFSLSKKSSESWAFSL